MSFRQKAAFFLCDSSCKPARTHGTVDPPRSLVVSDAAQPGKDHGRGVPDMRPTKGAIALSTRTVASLRLQRTQPPSR